MALAFLNLELERATETTLMTSLDLDNSGALDFREFVALVRRLSRLPLLTRLFQKYMALFNKSDERYMSHEIFDTLWRREQGEPPDERTLRLFDQCQSAPGMQTNANASLTLTVTVTVTVTLTLTVAPTLTLTLTLTQTLPPRLVVSVRVRVTVTVTVTVRVRDP